MPSPTCHIDQLKLPVRLPFKPTATKRRGGAAATPTPVSGTNALHSGATSACGRVARTEGGWVLMLLSYVAWVGGC